MASLQIDPSGNYHVEFRFAGKQYRRTLRTKMRRTAEASACHIEENIRLIEGGRLELPEDAELPQPDGNFMTPDKASYHLEIAFRVSRWENLRGWHVFRHSFISNCATQGVDQRFIDSWVCHQRDVDLITEGSSA